MTLFKHVYDTVCAQDKNPLFQNRNQPEYRDSGIHEMLSLPPSS